jgi:hypothetical protein
MSRILNLGVKIFAETSLNFMADSEYFGNEIGLYLSNSHVFKQGFKANF